MRFIRPAAIVAVVLATFAATAGTAAAAPPANDTFGGRITIGALPFSTTQDTSQATTDADDTELNAVCGAPAMDASVWYEVTAGADATLVADVSGSDYSAGVFVATGSPGSFVVEACAPGATAWQALAGQTYSIIVIDDQSDGAGNGGMMRLNVEQAPPTPTIDIAVTSGVHNKDGSATISGTVTCDSSAEFAFVDVQATQRVGRGFVNGATSIDVQCDGTARPWSAVVPPDAGKFAGGKAATISFGFACGIFDCGVDFDEHVVQLRGK